MTTQERARNQPRRRSTSQPRLPNPQQPGRLRRGVQQHGRSRIEPHRVDRDWANPTRFGRWPAQTHHAPGTSGRRSPGEDQEFVAVAPARPGRIDVIEAGSLEVRQQVGVECASR